MSKPIKSNLNWELVKPEDLKKVLDNKKVVSVDAKSFHGEEKINELSDKEWKVVDLPSEEEISEKKSTHPNSRNNINSRKNLAQYNKRSKESKKKSLEKLRYKETKETKEKPTESSDTPNKLDSIKNLLPIEDMFDPSEQVLYKNYLTVLLSDFDVNELSSGDIDDVISMAQMRVLEIRLLKACKDKPTKLLDASMALEKLRRDMQKTKENLGSRRRDRVSIKQRTDISIIDLAALFDNERKAELDAEEERLHEEGKMLLEEQSEWAGNKNDKDAEIIGEDEDDT